ncbi:MAG: ATP-binding protein, partial [Tissierellia bacterium]|nr:ATP-binding protein [Tissierellia bacterium]
ISRVKYTNSYPANFMLIAAMNPCPCGYYGNQKCRCTDYEVLKYRQKISGPISDRIDIQKYVQPVDFMNLSNFSNNVSSKELRERVERSRKIQNKRFENYENINCNAQMSQSLIKEYCILEEESRNVMQLAYDKFKYSARSFHKYLKVARTFADMDESEKIRKKDIISALMSRDMDKDIVQMTIVKG